MASSALASVTPSVPPQLPPALAARAAATPVPARRAKCAAVACPGLSSQSRQGGPEETRTYALRAGVDAGLYQPPRLQEGLHAERRQAQPDKGTEDNAGQPVEAADDVGEGADIEHLADQLRHYVLALARRVTERPVQPGDSHADGDQRGGRKAPPCSSPKPEST